MPRPSRAGMQALVGGQEAALQVIKRLKPPSELTSEQKREFTRVVNEMPADWFSPGHLVLLVQYCRHVVMARKVARLIDTMLEKENADPTEIGELVKRQEAESRIIGKLMTMLRLTPQALAPTVVSAKRAREGRTEEETPWNDFATPN